MPPPVFPDIDYNIDIQITPEFKTSVFQSLSGKESRISFRNYPIFKFKLSIDGLIQNKAEYELLTLINFMSQVNGMYAPFLFASPHDSECVSSLLGYGTGSASSYQLTRLSGSNYEPVNYINAVTEVLVDYVAVSQSLYTISSTGLLTFNTPPPNGSVIRWSGSFYYKCRLLSDSYDFRRILSSMYECNDIDFIGSVRDMI